MIAYIRELYEYRHLIFYLAWGQIKGGERDRWFGRLWNILDPLALLVIYYFVFNIAFQSRKENFEVFHIALLHYADGYKSYILYFLSEASTERKSQTISEKSP